MNKRKRKIRDLNKRVEELENIICPNGHDYKRFLSHYYEEGNKSKVRTIYMCPRCLKTKRVVKDVNI